LLHGFIGDIDAYLRGYQGMQLARTLDEQIQNNDAGVFRRIDQPRHHAHVRGVRGGHPPKPYPPVRRNTRAAVLL